MNHLILFLATIFTGYAGFLIVIFIFQKLFFPFFTKEELEKGKHALKS
ncbi:MAG TPA: hypothetical protein PLJ13_08340 [Cyclobacteriaceae bacterium]|nr:hypothetical protein [Cyclobacteriaceae bacterium]